MSAPDIGTLRGLTLPGTIPGLLRRGSPCRRLTLGDPVMQEPVLVHAVTDRARWDGDDGTEPCAEIRSGPRTWWPCRALALDLTDPTGRAHAAWWLAYKFHPDMNPTCSHFERRNGSWWLVVAGARHHCVWDDRTIGIDSDSLDEVRLPDGTHACLAEALRLVCLHVAGVAP